MPISPILQNTQTLNKIEPVDEVRLSPPSGKSAGYRVLIADLGKGDSRTSNPFNDFSGKAGQIAVLQNDSSWSYENPDLYLDNHLVAVKENKTIWAYIDDGQYFLSLDTKGTGTTTTAADDEYMSATSNQSSELDNSPSYDRQHDMVAVDFEKGNFSLSNGGIAVPYAGLYEIYWEAFMRAIPPHDDRERILMDTRLVFSTGGDRMVQRTRIPVNGVWQTCMYGGSGNLIARMSANSYVTLRSTATSDLNRNIRFLLEPGRLSIKLLSKD